MVHVSQVFCIMLTRKKNLSQYIEDYPYCSLLSSEENSDIITVYTGPCPSVSSALH